MRIKDVMTSPVVMVEPGRHIKEAARLMATLRISALPVVEADGRLVGLLTEADLVGHGQVADPRAHELPLAPAAGPVPVTVREVMSTAFATLTGEQDVAGAARLMAGHGQRAIPVVAADRVIGIVTRADLVAVLARSDEDIRSELLGLLDEVAGGPAPYRVEVRDGVVTFGGPAGEAGRRLPDLLARTVPGVLAVRFGGDGDVG